MNNLNWKNIQKLIESRSLRERAILFGAVFILIFYVWLVYIFDAMNASQDATQRQINSTVGQINNELTRNQQIQNTYTSDPNAFARTRRNELQAQVDAIDSQLLGLYGELILPSQMANILSDILRKETTLRLVSLENQAPEVLFDNGQGSEIQVYRHGLNLRLEGEYLETIRFMRQVEELNVNFFWESLSYDVNEYPDGTINLNIFTLSTQRGFIGV